MTSINQPQTEVAINPAYQDLLDGSIKVLKSYKYDPNEESKYEKHHEAVFLREQKTESIICYLFNQSQKLLNVINKIDQDLNPPVNGKRRFRGDFNIIADKIEALVCEKAKDDLYGLSDEDLAKVYVSLLPY